MAKLPRLRPLVRKAILLAFGGRVRRFEAALENPGDAQARVLREIVRSAAKTEYGARFGLRGEESYAEFAAKLPIVTYEDLEPWILRQRAEGPQVLSGEPVKVYEKTSGSSGASKLVPYTGSVMSNFHHVAILWICDLIRNGPKFETSKTFFSISQPFRTPEDGVGLEDDSEYLSPILRALVGSLLVNPKGLTALRDPDLYKLGLACALLAEQDLEIISIWNPTYLTSLLDFITANRTRILEALEAGEVTLEGRLFRFALISPERRKLLLEAKPSWLRLWPKLKLISAWTDGSAEFFAKRLQEEFPGVLLQGKGLLATEFAMTVPLLRLGAPVPIIDRVLYEFLDEQGRVHLAQELKLGQTYQLVLSQKAGFLRYKIGDRVSVVGFSGALGGSGGASGGSGASANGSAPCLRFEGRTNDVSDLVGEKLNEKFVGQAFENLGPSRDAYSFLVPFQNASGPSRYICVTNQAQSEEASFAERLDKELQKAFHYRQARLLKQLDRVQVVNRANARELYFETFTRRGMKWGDIKPSALVKNASAAEFGLEIS